MDVWCVESGGSDHFGFVSKCLAFSKRVGHGESSEVFFEERGIEFGQEDSLGGWCIGWLGGSLSLFSRGGDYGGVEVHMISIAN